TTNEELQTTSEELETTNEELQSTNEELETTNEELQSTNEELETTIEELQSTNEELETANDELRARQEELNAFARYQEMVLSSLQVGLIAIDRDYRVTSWNRQSEGSWGLREEEAVGKDLFRLDVGLDFEKLREGLQEALLGRDGAGPFEVEATNRRGRAVRCRVRINPMHDPDQRVSGVVVILEESPPPESPEAAHGYSRNRRAAASAGGPGARDEGATAAQPCPGGAHGGPAAHADPHHGRTGLPRPGDHPRRGGRPAATARQRRHLPGHARGGGERRKRGHSRRAGEG